ncbi:MAG: hypothetical protein MHPSP_002378 [Paramarteilia canceri]
MIGYYINQFAKFFNFRLVNIYPQRDEEKVEILKKLNPEAEFFANEEFKFDDFEIRAHASEVFEKASLFICHYNPINKDGSPLYYENILKLMAKHSLVISYNQFIGCDRKFAKLAGARIIKIKRFSFDHFVNLYPELAEKASFEVQKKITEKEITLPPKIFKKMSQINEIIPKMCSDISKRIVLEMDLDSEIEKSKKVSIAT